MDCALCFAQPLPILSPTRAFSSSQASAPPRITCCATNIPRRTLLSHAAALAGVTLLGNAFFPIKTRSEPSIIDTQLVESANATCAVPAKGWTKNVASLSGGRVATVFVSDDDSDSNISLVETPVGGDFQKLSSFGSVDRLLDNLAPKSFPENKVFSVTNDVKNNAYVIDYQLKPPGDRPIRRLLTVFSLKPGQYIITLTCQAPATFWPSKSETMRKVVDSFRLLREED